MAVASEVTEQIPSDEIVSIEDAKTREIKISKGDFE